MEPPGYVRIGKIVKAHGLKGAAKVFVYGDAAAIIEKGRRVLAIGGDGAVGTLIVKWAKPDNRKVLIAFVDIDDREQTERLIGCELFVEKNLLPELEDGTFYWTDIIGLDVVTVNNDYIGKVVSIIPTGANDVYVVNDGDTETLIPALEWVVLSIDPDRRTMRVDLPEGL